MWKRDTSKKENGTRVETNYLKNEKTDIAPKKVILSFQSPNESVIREFILKLSLEIGKIEKKKNFVIWESSNMLSSAPYWQFETDIKKRSN